MWSADSHSMQTIFRQSGSSVLVSMCRMVLLLALIGIQVHGSSETPPRLTRCRLIYKAKTDETSVSTSSWGTCVSELHFPIPQEQDLNLTDIRNCENYYKCKGVLCEQCPCPEGQTFNPTTSRCDSTNALCQCPGLATTTPSPSTTSRTTTKVVVTKKQVTPATTEKTTIIIADNNNYSDDRRDDGADDSKVIIIAAIVSGTVLVIVVIVMAVFLWHKNRRQRQSRPKPPPPLSFDGYSPTLPVSERHVYAEIDEGMIAGRKHWQHSGSQKVPPLPDHKPPTASSPCPVHSHTDSGVGSADTSFTANYPGQTFIPTRCPHQVRDAHLAHFTDDQIYHSREDSSASSESQYSNSSHQTSLDSHDVDMRTPLHNSRQNYISKQVYI